MSRIVSCFTNSYGAAGVRAAVERIREAGIDHLELALRGHNFGGLVIPESAVITEKADDADGTGVLRPPDASWRQDQRLQRRRGRHPHPRRTRADRAADPLRGPMVRGRRFASRAPASRPTPASVTRSSIICAGSETPPARSA